MKTLYLHIGTPKTASTAIQSFCGANQEILNSHGYDYPDLGVRYPYIRWQRNAHFLVGDLRGKERDLEKEEQLVAECFQKIYQSFQKYDNVVLSEERIWLEGIKSKEKIWKWIDRELKKGIFSVKVIVYLRRQDEFIYSRWNQQIKAAVGLFSPNYVRKWEEMLEDLSVPSIDYYGIITRIEKYVGKENIIVRQFDRKKFVGGTIYADFLNAVGLAYSDDYTIEQDTENISLTKNNLEIKRIVNGLPGLNETSNKILRNCLYKCSELPSDDKKYNMFSEQEMRELLARCEEGNNKIVEEYLDGEKKLFDDTYKAEEKWTPDNPGMMTDVIRFSGSLAIYLLKEHEELKHQLAELKSQLKEHDLVIDSGEDDTGFLNKKLKQPLTKVGKKVKNVLMK